MDLQSIEQVVKSHFASFGNLDRSDRHVSIIQSTRLSLAILKHHFLTKTEDGSKKNLENIFDIFDSSLRYILDPNVDEISEDVCSTCGGIEEVDELLQKMEEISIPKVKKSSESISRKKEATSKEKEKEVASENFSDDNDEDSDWASSLGNEGPDDGEEEEEKPQWPESENNIRILLVHEPERDIIGYLSGLSELDTRFLKLLEDLAKVNIFTDAPHKLYSFMLHHKNMFNCMKEAERNSLYTLPLKHGCKTLLEEYFAFEEEVKKSE